MCFILTNKHRNMFKGFTTHCLLLFGTYSWMVFWRSANWNPEHQTNSIQEHKETCWASCGARVWGAWWVVVVGYKMRSERYQSFLSHRFKNKRAMFSKYHWLLCEEWVGKGSVWIRSLRGYYSYLGKQVVVVL